MADTVGSESKLRKTKHFVSLQKNYLAFMDDLFSNNLKETGVKEIGINPSRAPLLFMDWNSFRTTLQLMDELNKWVNIKDTSSVYCLKREYDRSKTSVELLSFKN